MNYFDKSTEPSEPSEKIPEYSKYFQIDENFWKYPNSNNLYARGQLLKDFVIIPTPDSKVNPPDYHKYSNPPYFDYKASGIEIGDTISAALFYTRSLPNLCKNLGENLCETIGGLCIWGNVGPPASPPASIMSGECNNTTCCTICPQYLNDDLSCKLFEKINSYKDNIAVIKNVYSPSLTWACKPGPDGTTCDPGGVHLPLAKEGWCGTTNSGEDYHVPQFQSPRVDDSSMCLRCVCYHQDFSKENLVKYVQSADNRLYRCESVSDGNSYLPTAPSPTPDRTNPYQFDGIACGDATGPAESSYILKPLVYNIKTKTIISHKDLLDDNSVYPLNTFSKIYIDTLFKPIRDSSMSLESAPANIFYYFDSLNNRINIDHSKLWIKMKNNGSCGIKKATDLDFKDYAPGSRPV